MTTQSAYFEAAVAYVIKNEGGGTYTDNPLDHGRGTRWGITRATLDAWQSKKANPVRIQDLSRPNAESIYRAMYWEPLGLDRLESQAVATALFDLSVMAGTHQATLIMQECAGTKADGQLGPDSIRCINVNPPQALLPVFTSQAMAFLVRIARRDATQRQFAAGWLCRVAKYVLLTL